MIDGVSAVVSACERCGYIGVDRNAGILAHHLKVMTTVMQKHNKNFGVYLRPSVKDFRIVLHVGDEITIN